MAEQRASWWRKALQLAIGGLRAGLDRLIGLGALLPGSSAEELLSVVPSMPPPLVKQQPVAVEVPRQEVIKPASPKVEAAAEPVIAIEESAEVAPEMVQSVTEEVDAALEVPVAAVSESEVVVESESAPTAEVESAVPEPAVGLEPAEPEAEPVEIVSEAVEKPVEAVAFEAEADPEAAAEAEQVVTVAEPIQAAPGMVQLAEPEAAEAVEIPADSAEEPKPEVESLEAVAVEPVELIPEDEEQRAEVVVVEAVIEAEAEVETEPVVAAEELVQVAPEMVQLEKPEPAEIAQVPEEVGVEPEAAAEEVEEPFVGLAEIAPPAMELAGAQAVTEPDREPEAVIDPAPEEVAAVCEALEKELEPVERVAAELVADELDEEFVEAEASAQVLAAPAFIAYFSAPAGAVPEPENQPEAGSAASVEEAISKDFAAELAEEVPAVPEPVAEETVVELALEADLSAPGLREEALQQEPCGCEEAVQVCADAGGEDSSENSPEEADSAQAAEVLPEPESLPGEEIIPEVAVPEVESQAEATEQNDAESMTNSNEMAAPEEMEAAPPSVEAVDEEQAVEVQAESGAEISAEAVCELELAEELAGQAPVEENQLAEESAPQDEEEEIASEESLEAAASQETVAAAEPAAAVESELAPAPELAAAAVESAASSASAESAEPEQPSNLLQMPNPPTESESAANPSAPLAPVREMIKREMDDATPFGILVDKVYEGPLDLLLDLIRKQDIDIYDIPIAKLTAQFLAYVEKLKATDVDAAGEFIYMASLLIHIKSKMLLPRAPSGPEDAAEDPRRELVERLLEHERFKNAAQMLLEKQVLEAATWSNPGSKEFKDDQGAEAEIAADTTDLVRIFRTILERARTRPVFNVNEDQVTVGQMLQFLSRRLTMEDKPVALHRLLSSSNSERALICTFLALLELVRLQAILLRQDRAFSEIYVKKHTAFETVIGEALANARDDWQ